MDPCPDRQVTLESVHLTTPVRRHREGKKDYLFEIVDVFVPQMGWSKNDVPKKQVVSLWSWCVQTQIEITKKPEQTFGHLDGNGSIPNDRRCVYALSTVKLQHSVRYHIHCRCRLAMELPIDGVPSRNQMYWKDCDLSISRSIMIVHLKVPIFLQIPHHHPNHWWKTHMKIDQPQLHDN